MDGVNAVSIDNLIANKVGNVQVSSSLNGCVSAVQDNLAIDDGVTLNNDLATIDLQIHACRNNEGSVLGNGQGLTGQSPPALCQGNSTGHNSDGVSSHDNDCIVGGVIISIRADHLVAFSGDDVTTVHLESTQNRAGSGATVQIQDHALGQDHGSRNVDITVQTDGLTSLSIGNSIHNGGIANTVDGNITGQSVGVVIRIGITTYAGVKRVSLLVQSGRNYSCLVAVAECGSDLCTTYSTGLSILTVSGSAGNMAICDHNITGVGVTTSAGVGGVTNSSTGGLRYKLNILVTNGSNHHIGGVIAHRAILIGDIAVLSTGGSNVRVLIQSMTGSGNLHVSRVIANRAILVCVPANLNAGGCLSLNLSQRMTSFLGSLDILITTCTNVGGVASLSADGRSDNGYIAVTDSCDLSIGGVIANRAVLICDVTGLGTGSSLVLDLGQSVTKSSHCIIGVAVTTSTGVGGVTVNSAGRSSDSGYIVVSGSCDLSIGGVIANRAVLVCNVTGLGTGSSLVLDLSQNVARSSHYVTGMGVTTRTGIDGIAGLGTGGSNDSLHVLVTDGGNLHLGGIIALGAFLVCEMTDLGTGGSLVGNLSQSMAGGRNLHASGVNALGAVLICLVASLGAGSSLSLDLNDLMLVGLDRNGLTAQLIAANGAVNNVIVGTVGGAGSIDLVLNGNLALGVTQCVNLIVGVAVTTSTGVGGVTVNSAGRISDSGYIAVSGGLDLSIGGVIAN